MNDSTGNCNPLLLASREFGRAMFTAVTKADSFKGCDCIATCLTRGSAQQQQGQLYIFHCREDWKEVEVLEYEAKMLGSQISPSIITDAVERLTLDIHCPR